MHRLRYMVKHSLITNEELDEVETLLPMNSYFDDDKYEYNGNFILTKDLIARDEAVDNMCCGVVTQDLLLPSGDYVYFAFDYGH